MTMPERYSSTVLPEPGTALVGSGLYVGQCVVFVCSVIKKENSSLQKSHLRRLMRRGSTGSSSEYVYIERALIVDNERNEQWIPVSHLKTFFKPA